MRPIPHALNLGAPEIYGQGPTGQGARGTQVLEDVNMASMVGTLAQLGALATVSIDMVYIVYPRARKLRDCSTWGEGWRTPINVPSAVPAV